MLLYVEFLLANEDLGVQVEGQEAASPGTGPVAAPLPLFVAVNAGCNLRCWYCTERGENRFSGGVRLAPARLHQILEVAYEVGLRTFRFTGGEPTLRRSLPEIMRRTQTLGGDVRLALTTNGAQLDRLADTLAELTQPRVFLSVDGLGDGADPIEGEFAIEKWLTPRLMEVIDSLRPVAQVRLNFVLTASSLPQLAPLLGYATEQGLDVKVFELLLRDFYYAGHRPRMEVFREQYVSVHAVTSELQELYGPPQPFTGTGGRGIPMWSFDTGRNRIAFFDSSQGSHYGDACRDCPLFPCQEGLYALILDANGILHPAGCTNGSLQTPLGVASQDDLLTGFKRLQNAIRRAHLQPVVPDFLTSNPLLVHNG